MKKESLKTLKLFYFQNQISSNLGLFIAFTGMEKPNKIDQPIFVHDHLN
jgi:hypothetical protein